jgi:hypothetical protein
MSGSAGAAIASRPRVRDVDEFLMGAGAIGVSIGNVIEVLMHPLRDFSSLLPWWAWFAGGGVFLFDAAARGSWRERFSNALVGSVAVGGGALSYQERPNAGLVATGLCLGLGWALVIRHARTMPLAIARLGVALGLAAALCAAALPGVWFLVGVGAVVLVVFLIVRVRKNLRDQVLGRAEEPRA